jgi:predicted MPP superfamily phosphohydrolase
MIFKLTFVLKNTQYFLFMIGIGVFGLLHAQLAWGQSLQSTRVAFLADIHLQDIYGDFEVDSFKGVWNPKSEKFATIRTMQSQLNSTRLFNENYFALFQALENLGKEGVKLVVLPGDFTDDGQPMNVKTLRRILDQYAEKYDMRFFITTGNHDPVSPFGSEDSKEDFMGEKGQKILISSSSIGSIAQENSVVSPQIQTWGYYEICQELKDHGFHPSPKDVFWTHPFQDLNYEGYSFEQALQNSPIEKRRYLEQSSGWMIPDASYVVEPVAGIWLLALDGNVYSHGGDTSALDSSDWKGSSIGFNLASKAKRHQLDWIKSISDEAKRRDKMLISFSHYPLVDFHDGASEDMKSLFGESKHQLVRVPNADVSQLYADAGIRLHFAGHMHINDTGILQVENENRLINIQVPSLAAFPPAYKIMSLLDSQTITIQTQTLKSVKDFDELFDLYQMEHAWLGGDLSPKNWSSEILRSEDYLSFTRFHLRELIRLRFLKSDWSDSLGNLVRIISTAQLQEWLDSTPKNRPKIIQEIIDSSSDLGVNSHLLEDFYLLKNGGDLGAALIPASRMDFYKSLKNISIGQAHSHSLNSQFEDLLRIMGQLATGFPSGNLEINLNRMEIKKLD